MKQNHMFDVAFTVESTNNAEDVTNEEILKALAKRWASLCQEFKDDLHKPYGEAFGYSDSYDVKEEETKEACFSMSLYNEAKPKYDALMKSMEQEHKEKLKILFEKRKEK
jgi:hypothetical protein